MKFKVGTIVRFNELCKSMNWFGVIPKEAANSYLKVIKLKYNSAVKETTYYLKTIEGNSASDFDFNRIFFDLVSVTEIAKLKLDNKL